MPSLEFDHAGIATREPDRLAELYGDLLGADVVHEEEIEGMGVTFLDAGGGYLELLEPGGDDPIGRYLDDEGPGIHHLAFRTDDLPAAVERARALDVDPIDDDPRPGAWGSAVAFLHPASTGGVLIELVDR